MTMNDLYFNGTAWVRVWEDGTTTFVRRKPPRKPFPDQRRRIMERDEYQCVWCYATENLSIDHIIPISKGGLSVDENLRVLCVPCNADKGDGPDIPPVTVLKRRANNLRSSA